MTSGQDQKNAGPPTPEPERDQGERPGRDRDVAERDREVRQEAEDALQLRLDARASAGARRRGLTDPGPNPSRSPPPAPHRRGANVTSEVEREDAGTPGRRARSSLRTRATPASMASAGSAVNGRCPLAWRAGHCASRRLLPVAGRGTPADTRRGRGRPAAPGRRRAIHAWSIAPRCSGGRTPIVRPRTNPNRG